MASTPEMTHLHGVGANFGVVQEALAHCTHIDATANMLSKSCNTVSVSFNKKNAGAQVQLYYTSSASDCTTATK